VRHDARGEDLATMVCLGTYSKCTVVNEASCVKILDDIPLDKACLVGCGVTTGWGSFVYAADVRPGDNVAVIGVGGIGASALQGARLAGAERIFAIDPVELKRTLAPRFGATHTAASIDDAFALVREETWGRMCDKVICAHRQERTGRGDQHPSHGRGRRQVDGQLDLDSMFTATYKLGDINLGYQDMRDDRTSAASSSTTDPERVSAP
jgi:Zn-dependent alcohol dehydrogenase